EAALARRVLHVARTATGLDLFTDERQRGIPLTGEASTSVAEAIAEGYVGSVVLLVNRRAQVAAGDSHATRGEIHNWTVRGLAELIARAAQTCRLDFPSNKRTDRRPRHGPPALMATRAAIARGVFDRTAGHRLRGRGVAGHEHMACRDLRLH